jgi:hypothetical protein
VTSGADSAAITCPGWVGAERPTFPDSTTMRVACGATEVGTWLWLALSPFGYLTFRLIQWLAGRLHEARRA